MKTLVRAAFLASLLLSAATTAFPLGLEKAGFIDPSGMDTGLMNPAALWYDNLRGTIVVANTHARQVAILNRQGQALKVLGKQSEIGFPVAVATGRDGTLYIAEKNSESLRVLPRYDAAAGDEYGTLDLSGYRRTGPVEPTAIYIDDAGRLYVVDRGNRQVLVLAADGKLNFSVPDVGEPTDVWVERSGNILVADPGFGGIRIHDAKGRFLRTVGRVSSQFREPLRVKGMAADIRGRIWVVDEAGQGIKALDNQGNLLFTLKNEFFSPSDLAVDREDNLYVLEQGGNRISVFRIIGN